MSNKYKISVFLLKEEYIDFNDAIREDKGWNDFDIDPKLNITGKGYIGDNEADPVNWNGLLREGLLEYPEQQNQSSRVLLLIRHQSCIFAFSFGFGRYLLKSEAYERDFGMKVVLNNANQSSLRSIDASIIDENTINSRSQATKSSLLSEFDFNDMRTLFRAVTAEAKDNKRYGKIISGRASFHFSKELNFMDFKHMCKWLYKDYRNPAYKRRFPELDKLKEISDPQLKNQLYEILIKKTKVKDDVHVMVPEIIDWEDTLGFRYSPKGELFSDINIDDLHSGKFRRLKTIDYDCLKKHKIYHFDHADSEKNKWSIIDCLASEVKYNDETYVHSIGKWFHVSSDLISTVNDFIEQLEVFPDVFPEFEGERESEINERIVDSSSDYLLMDKDNIRIYNNQYEVCDILTKNKELIHIKWWDRSSTLSHLFSQGRVSAEAIDFESERKKIDAKITELNPSFSNIIGVSNFNTRDYTVVFGIIYDGHKTVKDRLPFFSKVNLMHNAEMLKRMRYNVKIKHIYSKVKRKSKSSTGS